jgi:hypothetical protein
LWRFCDEKTVFFVGCYILISTSAFSESRLIFSRELSQNNFNENQYVASSFENAALGNGNYYKILVMIWYNQNRQGLLKISPNLTDDEVYMQFTGTIGRDGRMAILYIRKSSDFNSSTEFIIDAIKLIN